MNVLDYLLRNKRPSGLTEAATARAVLGNNATMYYNEQGQFMAATVIIGQSSTLFTAHLDTVDHAQGTNRLTVWDDKGSQFVKAESSILGADNGAGVYLLTAMMDNNIQGTYHFYAEEECGSVGSKWLVKNHPELYQGLLRAIAFDRKGTSDVIVEQLGGECCSPKFAIALCDALTCDKYAYEPAIGVFTDTANMIGLIPECTNIAVGYYNEHTDAEYLDLTYLRTLLSKCLTIDWEGLPVIRVAAPRKAWGNSRNNKVSTYYDEFDNYSYLANDDISHDQAVDEVIDRMIMRGITITDLLDYIRESGNTDLL